MPIAGNDRDVRDLPIAYDIEDLSFFVKERAAVHAVAVTAPPRAAIRRQILKIGSPLQRAERMPPDLPRRVR
jgi:hypothetical protein